MLVAALLLASAANAGCSEVRSCQERASSWEDGAWFGVGVGWTGIGAAFALESTRSAEIFDFGIPVALTGFGLSVPLMAAAANPSRRAVDLSGNPLGNELRRRPRYWGMYALGMGVAAGSAALVLTDTGPWWLPAATSLGAAGVLTGSAAGFARDARWIRRQAPISHGRPRHPVHLRLEPLPAGMRLAGTW